MLESRIGRYAIIRPLGRGGVGEVFLAQDVVTQAEWALKLLRGDIVRDPTALAREFDVLSRLRHPSIVEVRDFGQSTAGPWYTMEYVAGGPASGLTSPAFVAEFGYEVTLGLEALHGAGVIHGDVKPANLLLATQLQDDQDRVARGNVRIVDFGMAAHLDAAALRTRAGTAGFAAPEVVRGDVVSVASDLYGLGATLYALIAGREAFHGAMGDRLRQQVAGPPSSWPLEEAGAPPALTTLILRLLADAPRHRPGSAAEVREELERAVPAVRRSLAERLGTERLIGRERELGQLQAWVSHDGGRILTILGEPGVGRSALLVALASRCALAGRPIMRVRAAADGRSLARALEQEVAAISGAAVTSQCGAGEGLCEAMAAVTGGLLIVDDADGLDDDGRALLRRMACDPRLQLKILQVREGQGPLHADERPLQLSGQLTQLRLAPLDQDGTERLIASRLGGLPPEGLGEAVHARSGGHPGVTMELLHTAVRIGVVREGAIGLEVDITALQGLQVSRDFAATRLGRLDGAPPSVARAALGLAIGGRPMRVDEVAAVLKEDSAAALRQLQGLGLAAVEPDGRVRFDPPGLAAALIELAETTEVRALHAAAAQLPDLSPNERFEHVAASLGSSEALGLAEELWKADATQAPAARAALLAEGGHELCAGLWHSRAAEQAWGRGRYDEVATHLNRAVTIAPGANDASAWMARLAQAEFRSGRLEEAGASIEAALAREPSDATRARLLTTESARRYALGDLHAGLSAANEAMRLATVGGEPLIVGDAALTAGSILLALDRLPEASSMAQFAADRYGQAGHVLGETRASLLLALLKRRAGRHEDAAAACRTAIALAAGNSSRLALEEAHLQLAQVLGDTGRGDECRQSYETALRIALEDGRGLGVTVATLNLAQFEGLSGQPRMAIRLARRGVRLAKAYLPAHLCFAWRSLAQGRRAIGRLRAAQRAAERALQHALPVAAPDELAWCRAELGRVLFERGQFAAVKALGDSSRRPGPIAWLAGDAVLELVVGRAALREGQRRQAAESAGRVMAWLAGRSAPYVGAGLSQLKAELALLEGRLAEGIERLECALAGLESIPAPHDGALALYDAARLVWSSAQPDGRAPVRDWLRRAASMLAALGDRHREIRAGQVELECLRRHLETGTWDIDRGLLEKVGRLLQALDNQQALTRQAMQLAVEQLDAERGVLLIEDEATRTFEPVAECGASDATAQEEALRFSRQLVQRVVSEGRSILVYDAPRDPQAATESVDTLGLRALLCVPMFLYGRVVGAVYLDSRRPGAFSAGDRALLEGFAQLMVAALEGSRTTEKLAHENRLLKQEMTSRIRAGLIGSGLALQRLMPTIESAARSRATVLLTGETGTGKGVVARIIHESGTRSRGPYIFVDCALLPKDLIETELFGIMRGVASNVEQREGRFQMADGGTIFLDEIGEMPLEQQAKLLSIIDRRQVMPVGGKKPIPVDVRIIAATNRDLEAEVEAGRFRQDLYYRLSVLAIEMPPLRTRKGDIPELARHFACHYAAQNHRPTPELAPDFMADLMSRDWSGNVRQLENYIEKRIVSAQTDVLHAEPGAAPAAKPARANPRRRLADQVEALERQLLVEALRICHGNKSAAARMLDLKEPTMRSKLLKYDIAQPRKNLRA